MARHGKITQTTTGVEAASGMGDVILWPMEFEWDPVKAAANSTQHGVSFDEAMTVFEDPMYVDFYDPDHYQ